MAISTKRARKYFRRTRVNTRMRSTGIRAPRGSRGYFPQRGVGNRRRGVRVELKKWDHTDGAAGTGLPPSATAFTITASPTINVATSVFCICCPGTGSDFSQRIGRRVQVKMIQVNYWIRPLAATFQAVNLSVMCVVDMQHNGTTNPNIDSIIQSAAAISGSEFMNLDNRSRFKLIFRRHHCIFPNADWNVAAPNTSTTIASNLDSMHQEIVKKVNFPITFGGTGIPPATGDIQTGAVLLLAWASAGGYQLVCSTRCRFTDA